VRISLEFVMRVIGLIILLLLYAVASVAAPAALSGKWRIVAIDGADTFDPAKTLAEFAGDGRFASTIGCNRLLGRPTVTGTRLAFGPMAATRMACIPPLDRVESRYLVALQAVRSYRLEGDTLEFVGASGEALLRLERLK
jgi:heat shock protein HslJ